MPNSVSATARRKLTSSGGAGDDKGAAGRTRSLDMGLTNRAGQAILAPLDGPAGRTEIVARRPSQAIPLDLVLDQERLPRVRPESGPVRPESLTLPCSGKVPDVVETVFEGVVHVGPDHLPANPRFARRNLSEEATRYLRDALLSGRYRAGDKMTLHPLAQALHMSAMPVREALHTLAAEGLLEATPRHGFQVTRSNLRDIQDVFRVHALVAGLLAEEAAPLFDRSLVRTLLELQAQIELASTRRITVTDRATLVEQHNFAFHRTINHVPDAPRLRWFLRASTRYVPRHFYHQIPGWVEATRSDHPRIIDALRRHDAAEARRLVEQHTLAAGRLVTDNLASKDLLKE